MAKKEIEVNEISTTDKLKAFKALKEAGYTVEFNGSGVPTVIVKNPDDIKGEIKKVKKILSSLRYTGSFGVRSIRKNDQVSGDMRPASTMMDDTEDTQIIEETVSETEDGQAIPA
ncbi:hypothetical protein [Butyrivibrio proteoclasticus]|uniref:hypothetical protein n=1 Tax=Butyrivibrio proteoclasticus TaxID=43305 RepID=UPI00047DFAD0|nr:hypothetical protein [Butyrivibrio proteoclasticus]